jgi:hypothetical protein
MEISLQPEKEAQLAQIAAQRGLKTDELAQEVLSRYREDDHFSSPRSTRDWRPLNAENLWSMRKLSRS